MGGVFLPSIDGIKQQTFSMDFILPRVERFLSEELPRIVSASEVPWHYNHRCKTCKFVEDCRKDAKGTIAMIPYLSVDDASDLKQAVPKEGEVDIEDLVNYVNNIQIDSNVSNVKKVKQIIRYNEDRKQSPYLESKTENAQYIGIPTATFPQETDHNLIIAMFLDPFVSRPFGWAICLYTNDGKIMKEFQHADSNLKSEKNETLSSFISLMNSFVTHLEEAFKYLCQEGSRACIFVYEEKEKTLIQDSLLELITLDPDKISKDIQPIQHKAMQCFLNLFDDCSLLLAIKNDDNENSEIPDGLREFPRLIVLEHSLSENIAINVPGFYQITDVWEQMVKPTLKNDQELNSLDPSNIDLESIYATWDSMNKERINKNLLFRTEFVNVAIQAYYSLLKKFTDNIASILIFSPQKFKFSEVQKFNHHYLGKLYFFTQFEAVTSSSQKRADRLKDFVQGEAICGILLEFDEFVEENHNETIAQFIVCDETSHKLETNNFTNFILTEDSAEGTREAICFSDMKYKKKFSGCPLPVLALIKVVDNSESIAIHLKGEFQKKRSKLQKNAKFRLYKRYLDFNTDKILGMLINIDKQKNSLSLEILKDPNAWSTSLPEKLPEKLKTIALNKCDSFTPSQKKISEALLEKRLQIIWGPPGSGKTHFLALFVTWYLTEVIPLLREKKANTIIGITANTNTTIDNLLERISVVQKRMNKTDDFLLVRMTTRSTRPSNSNDITYCTPQELNFKDAYKHTVVGGTIWDWHKIYDKQKIDIMIIDEGSQLLVANACVALECLNQTHGKLIIAGDHMQLGPIIQNTSHPAFSDDHPLIFGSTQQCLMRKVGDPSFNEDDFFLKKGQNHDYGPCTLQLKENWRMNCELNSFFQEIYGDDYISKNRNLEWDFKDDDLSHRKSCYQADIVSWKSNDFSKVK
ncbi:hypothetical protein C2G38_1747950 [Gigaspora rosea]|uniref:Helicase ATP-binding domain-containing protein n=1 Tax=Gigaspora rosea TaxID=44941 RepID=A0A397USV4_9GLOM|nr:hypothetical protein C2G38_1747950 [Gigaspora rosea]